MLKGEAMCEFEAPNKEADIWSQAFQTLVQSFF